LDEGIGSDIGEIGYRGNRGDKENRVLRKKVWEDMSRLK
jgi:hypothetical protein